MPPLSECVQLSMATGFSILKKGKKRDINKSGNRMGKR